MTQRDKREFLRRAKAAGWKPLDGGWPDFLLVRKNEKGGVEVMAAYTRRDPAHMQSLSDGEAIAALTLQGVDCYEWVKDADGFRKYERIDAQKKIDDFLRDLDAKETREAVRELRARGVRSRL